MAAERLEVEQYASNTPSDSGTTSGEDEIEELGRTGTNATSRTVREREFEPICAGDREELTRLATTFSRRESVLSVQNIGDEIKRKDTLAGIELGDSVLDPTSPDFDAYKWARMYVLHIP